VGLGAHAETERRLLPIAKLSSIGPPADVVGLAEWAAWRWAGPVTRFLRTASPPGVVMGLPPPAPSRAGARDRAGFELAVRRVPPAVDAFPLVLDAIAPGDALVLTPSLSEAAILAARLRRAGHAVASMPRDWARAAAGGCVVVGSRAGAWAPVPNLAAVVVLDEHDEAYQEERAPTWNARDVAIERARRAGVPCLLISPCPSLTTLAVARLQTPSRPEERAGWPVVEVIDRRAEPPGLTLYSKQLVPVVRAAHPGGRVVCVLNRKGRSVLLACVACGELARCELCHGPLESVADGTAARLRCRRCGAGQPAVCPWCGGTRFKALRVGVARAREELELLAGQPVADVTAESPAGPPPDAAVLVGTEAVLHRVAGADVVVFLDFDQELLAPRYRAGEEALALLARAGRLVGGRDGAGGGRRVVVQTRLPEHEVLDAAIHGDPGRLAVVEAARRAALRLPPEMALARLSGPGAPALAHELRGHLGVDVAGPAGERWLARAEDHRTLCDALAAVRPLSLAGERARIEVDPLRA
jgi:primosomal protein N' (replication factor Y)